MLELVDVRKSFRDQVALRGLGFTVAPGEVVGFVGPNGAGKTTCMRLLVGLLFRDGGELSVLGMDPGTDGLAVRARCSYLPGETSLYQGMTGQQMLDFAWSFHPGHDRGMVELLREPWALPLDHKVRAYSAGMKQKLALLASLVPDVDLYLLDEPDRNLDAEARFWLREALRRLHQRGKTVLFSSHHLAEVEAVTQRQLFVLDGRLVDDAVVQAARERLRRSVRIRLTNGATLPPGADVVATEPDGTLRVEPHGEPLRWIATLQPGSVATLEVGPTRLEDLFHQLTRQDGGPR